MAVNASATAGEHSGSGHFFPPKNHQCQDAQLKKLLCRMPSKINDNDFKQDFHLQSSSTNMIPTLSSSAKNISKVKIDKST